MLRVCYAIGMSRDSFKTPLIVEVMDGGKTFRLYNRFTYLWKLGDIEIGVGAGFVTDFASIPRIARWLIPKLGRYNKAAVVHDAIYQNQASYPPTTFWLSGVEFARSEADLVFLDGMRDLGVVKWKRTLMYWAVRMCGWMAWKKR